jgi:membrane protease YdiL (CAAX protease family)
MPLFAQQPPALPTVTAIALAVLGVAFLGAWTAIGSRLRQGKAILPREPRRGVPWRGAELLLIVIVYFLVQQLAAAIAGIVLGPELTRPLGMVDLEKRTTVHPVISAMLAGGPWVVFMCGLSAAVVAPIAEEFFFRVLLQGWLETQQRRWRRHLPTLRRWLPGASGPILLTSLLFGMVHFRAEVPMMHPYYYVGALVATSVANLVTLALAVGLIRLSARATAADFGWAPEKLLADVKLGVLTFAAIGAPLYCAQLLLPLALPEHLRGLVAPDPLVLFVFALVQGTLYSRTHRIVAPIVLHFCLNATSLLVFLVALMWE